MDVGFPGTKSMSISSWKQGYGVAVWRCTRLDDCAYRLRRTLEDIFSGWMDERLIWAYVAGRPTHREIDESSRLKE